MSAFLCQFLESTEFYLLQKWLSGEEGSLAYVHLQTLARQGASVEAGRNIRETLYGSIQENSLKIKKAEQAMKLLVMVFDEGCFEVKDEILLQIDGSLELKRVLRSKDSEKLKSLVDKIKNGERKIFKPKVEPSQGNDSLGGCVERESKVLQFRKRLMQKYSLRGREGERQDGRKTTLTVADFQDTTWTGESTPRGELQEKSMNVDGKKEKVTGRALIDGSFECFSLSKQA